MSLRSCVTNSGFILVPFWRNRAIPVPFRRIPVIPADSGAIPPESGHSCRNLWGTEKYCIFHHHHHYIWPALLLSSTLVTAQYWAKPGWARWCPCPPSMSCHHITQPPMMPNHPTMPINFPTNATSPASNDNDKPTHQCHVTASRRQRQPCPSTSHHCHVTSCQQHPQQPNVTGSWWPKWHHVTESNDV